MMKRRRVFAMVVASMAGLVLWPGVAGLPAAAEARAPADDRALQLLPNLQGFAPFDLSVQVHGQKRKIRLSAEVANAGIGPLELYPIKDDCNDDGDYENDRSAYQRIYGDGDGDGIFTREVDVISSSSLAGCFAFSVEHGHWHFQGWARYDLSRLSDGKVLASSGKVSFCAIDTTHPYPELPGSPPSSFYVSCDPEHDQGLSIGWSDVYAAGLPGQAIDVRRVRDGTYCLAVTADPDDELSENDEDDNRSGVTVELTGSTIVDLGGSC